MCLIKDCSKKHIPAIFLFVKMCGVFQSFGDWEDNIEKVAGEASDMGEVTDTVYLC